MSILKEHRGRPPLSQDKDDPTVTLVFKVPLSMRRQLEAVDPAADLAVNIRYICKLGLRFHGMQSDG